MKAVIVIVNYNTRDELRDCLDSLGNCLDRVVVYDNRSTDGSAELVRSQYPQARLLVSPANSGYGAAANRAVAACGGAEFVIVSNSDVLFQPDSLQKLTQYLEENPRVGIAGPRLLNADGTLQASCFPLPGSAMWLVDNDGAAPLLAGTPWLGPRLLRAWDHRGEREVPWVKGAVLAIRRSAFEEVGGFDEAFFMYYEETDLCYRLAAKGWGVRFTPVTEVVHLGGASTSKVRGKMARELFIGSMRFARFHYGWIHRELLLGFWKLILLYRTWRDWRRLRQTGEPGIREDLEAWKSILGWGFKDLEK